MEIIVAEAAGISGPKRNAPPRRERYLRKPFLVAPTPHLISPCIDIGNGFFFESGDDFDICARHENGMHTRGFLYWLDRRARPNRLRLVGYCRLTVKDGRPYFYPANRTVRPDLYAFLKRRFKNQLERATNKAIHVTRSLTANVERWRPVAPRHVPITHVSKMGSWDMSDPRRPIGRPTGPQYVYLAATGTR